MNAFHYTLYVLRYVLLGMLTGLVITFLLFGLVLAIA